MNLRDIPVIPTIIVAAAIATMIALGFWQLGRSEEKTELLVRYQTAPVDGATIAYPEPGTDIEPLLYRKVETVCETPSDVRGVAGTNVLGVKGWAHVTDCTLENGAEARVDLGWSRNPQSPEYAGGAVSGILAPNGRIVADPPLAGLGPLAKPDPADLPNNHLAYAGQWFFFALTALVIYILALRRRRRSA